MDQKYLLELKKPKEVLERAVEWRKHFNQVSFDLSHPEFRIPGWPEIKLTGLEVPFLESKSVTLFEIRNRGYLSTKFSAKEVVVDELYLFISEDGEVSFTLWFNDKPHDSFSSLDNELTNPVNCLLILATFRVEIFMALLKFFGENDGSRYKEAREVIVQMFESSLPEASAEILKEI